jgi:hypothetical protein
MRKIRIVHLGYELVVGDHNFHVVNPAPSVTLLTEVKENPNDGGLSSLYKGMFITLYRLYAFTIYV